MMSGLLDEVVPKEHMQGLWQLVIRRGSTAEEKEKDETVQERKPEDTETPSLEGKRYTIYEHARTHSTYAEFEGGMHSKDPSYQGSDKILMRPSCR